MLTRARVTFSLLIVLCCAMLTFIGWVVWTGDDTPLLSLLLPSLMIGGLLVLHLRGWRHSANALIVSIVLIVIAGTPASYMRGHLTITALVPTVLAAVLLSPRWTISIFIITMLGLALHLALLSDSAAGITLGPTFDIVNLLILAIITAGIATASAVARTAQHAAEAQAHQAHAAARRADEALALLDTVVQSAPIGFAFVDRDLRYQLINPQLATLNGLPAAAHIGHTLHTLLPERAASVTPILQQVLAHGQAVLDVELAVVDPARQGQHWLCNYYPVRTRDGELLGVGTVTFDLSERKQAEQALRESEQRFRATFEQAPVGIAHIIPGGHLLRVNQQMCDILGYTRAELLTRTIYDIGGPKLRAIARAGAPQLLAHQVTSVTLEDQLPRNDGVLIWIDVTVSLMSDDRGAPQYFIAVVEDITERKQAEAALATRARLDALSARVGVALTTGDMLQSMLHSCTTALVEQLDAALARIWTLDDAGQMLELQASAGMYTLSSTQFSRVPIGMHTIGMIAQERRSYHTNTLPADQYIADPAWVVREGLVAFVGYPLIVADRLVGVLGLFVRHALSDSVLAALAPLADTIALGIERKQAEQALVAERALLAQRVEERTADLSAANAELARAARLKDEFLASMSHELRTPLNAVLGLSEALREQIYGPLSERQDRTLQTIEESGRHLLDLINDILDLAKIGAGKLDLSIAPIEIAPVCQASLRLIQRAAQKKSIDVQFELGVGAEWVQADARRLKQILMNLLSNAVKFTPSGGTVGLEAAADADRSVVELTVWDTGIGIAPDQQPHLFQPFVQLDGRLARQYEGTGLGLALVARMAELHGGSVAVTSTPNVGSRFSVTLPIGRRDSSLIADH